MQVVAVPLAEDAFALTRKCPYRATGRADVSLALAKTRRRAKRRSARTDARAILRRAARDRPNFEKPRALDKKAPGRHLPRFKRQIFIFAVFRNEQTVWYVCLRDRRRLCRHSAELSKGPTSAPGKISNYWNRRNRLGVSVTRHAPPFPRFPAPASMSNDFRRLLAPGSPPTSSSR